MAPDPPSKRRKTSDADLALDIPANHVAYTKWALDRGIEINGVTPAALPGRGVGLLAKEKIPQGSLLVRVPEMAMIKPDMAILRRHKLSKVSSQAQLAAYLSLERKKQSSVYVASKSVWPTPDDFASCMLACSSEDELNNALRKWAPPGVQKPLDRLLSDLRRDVESVKHLRSADDKTFDEDYLYHWILVNTRSFHWKPHGSNHGAMVMCPFLDYMNHCPNGNGVCLHRCCLNMSSY